MAQPLASTLVHHFEDELLVAAIAQSESVSTDEPKKKTAASKPLRQLHGVTNCGACRTDGAGGQLQAGMSGLVHRRYSSWFNRFHQSHHAQLFAQENSIDRISHPEHMDAIATVQEQSLPNLQLRASKQPSQAQEKVVGHKRPIGQYIAARGIQESPIPICRYHRRPVRASS